MKRNSNGRAWSARKGHSFLVFFVFSLFFFPAALLVAYQVDAHAVAGMA